MFKLGFFSHSLWMLQLFQFVTGRSQLTLGRGNWGNWQGNKLLECFMVTSEFEPWSPVRESVQCETVH